MKLVTQKAPKRNGEARTDSARQAKAARKSKDERRIDSMVATRGRTVNEGRPFGGWEKVTVAGRRACPSLTPPAPDQ